MRLAELGNSSCPECASICPVQILMALIAALSSNSTSHVQGISSASWNSIMQALPRPQSSQCRCDPTPSPESSTVQQQPQPCPNNNVHKLLVVIAALSSNGTSHVQRMPPERRKPRMQALLQPPHGNQCRCDPAPSPYSSTVQQHHQPCPTNAVHKLLDPRMQEILRPHSDPTPSPDSST